MTARRTFLGWGLSSALAPALVGATATSAAAARDDRFQRLRRFTDGQLVLPDDADYRTARRSQMQEFDNRHPAAVLHATTVEDVRRAVLFAQDEDVPLSVRSGGHHLQGWSTGHGLVLDLSRLNPRARVTGPSTVEVGSGNTSLDTLEQLAPHGLALPAGICATVCSGGFVSGGGVGLLTPHSGLGADGMRAAEVVLADGRVVAASDEDDPDLLWALRGGGSNFGVITKFTMRADALDHVTNYVMAWPFTAADRVGSAWQHWQAERPEALGSALMLLHAGEVPGAVPMVVVMGMWTGDTEALQPHLDELAEQAGTPPLVNLSLPQPYREAMIQWWALGMSLPPRPITEDLLRPHALVADVFSALVERPAFRTIQGRFFDRPMPPAGIDRWVDVFSALVERPAFRTIQGRFFDRPMPPAGIDRWVDAFATDPRPGQTRISMGLRTGGRAAEPDRTSTAYVHRDSSFHLDFSTQQNLSADIAADKAAALAWTKNGLDVLTPHSTGEAYLNFPEADLPDWERAYFAENLDRLKRTKRHYDPHDVFDQAQGVTPA